MRNLGSLLIALVIAYFAFDASIRYGSIWDMQANPKENVVVELNAATTVTGSLSRTWSGDYIIVKANGEQWQFNKYQSMSFPIPQGEVNFLSLWRSMLPATLVAWLYILWLLMPGIRLIPTNLRAWAEALKHEYS